MIVAKVRFYVLYTPFWIAQALGVKQRRVVFYTASCEASRRTG